MALVKSLFRNSRRLAMLGVGAGLGYLLDPENGPERRASLKQALSSRTGGGSQTSSTATDPQFDVRAPAAKPATPGFIEPSTPASAAPTAPVTGIRSHTG